MRIKLHEIELHTKNPAQSREFYEKTLGVRLNHSVEGGLNVFETGWSGLDLNTSVHRPGKVVLSFLVDDLPAAVAQLREKGMGVTDPKPTHFEMLAVSFEDPDGHVVQLQGLTAKSPDWLKKQFGL